MNELELLDADRALLARVRESIEGAKRLQAESSERMSDITKVIKQARHLRMHSAKIKRKHNPW